MHPDYLLRNHVLEELRQSWFSLTKYGWHDAVAGMIKDRQIELALDGFESMRQEGMRIESWLYDMMIYTLCSVEEFDAAIDLMEYRVSDGEGDISATLWYHLLDTASQALHHAATLFVYRARVEAEYLNPSSGMCINILNTAARHGDTYLATSVLRILGRRSGHPLQTHHYEALLETYVVAEDVATAFTLLTVMAAAGHPPSEASTRPLYLYLRHSTERPKHAVSILKHLHEQDRQIPVEAANVIMQASVFHKDLPYALSIYKTLHTYASNLKPNTASFNILFRGCAQAARKETAMFLASEMTAMNITPDTLTYDRLILVCLKSENSTEDAWRYFNEMLSFEWWPRDGTVLEMAKRACEQSDERIWALKKNPNCTSVCQFKLDRLMEKEWQGGIKDGHEESNEKN